LNRQIDAMRVRLGIPVHVRLPEAMRGDLFIGSYQQSNDSGDQHFNNRGIADRWTGKGRANNKKGSRSCLFEEPQQNQPPALVLEPRVPNF
jgi:hypothetical protein